MLAATSEAAARNLPHSTIVLERRLSAEKGVSRVVLHHPEGGPSIVILSTFPSRKDTTNAGSPISRAVRYVRNHFFRPQV